MSGPPAPPGGTSVLVFGRDPGCDVVIDHETVSSRHARLVMARGGLLLEDLGSTNGTFVRGQPISRVAVERGADVRLGAVQVPWGDPRVATFVRRGAASGTVMMSQVPRDRAAVPAPRHASPSLARRVLGFAAGGAFGLASLAIGVQGYRIYGPSADPAIGGNVEASPTAEPNPGGNDPASIVRRTRAAAIAAAIDPTSAVTRDTAVKIAAGEEGPFHIEQVARIWSHVRGRWRYVNDPHGQEYFAKASETIGNQFVGDCDDFAIVLSAMVSAIGGESRVVLMNSAEGGHAYSEVCIRMEPTDLSNRLAAYYRRKWDPYLGRQRVERIHYRTNDTCPIWLNLDWSAGVPGGGYSTEEWAVAVNPDGETVALAPAVADPPTRAATGGTRTATGRSGSGSTRP